MLTNSSMTIYSRSVSGGEEAWTRSVVDAVEWEDSRMARVARTGVLESDRVVVFIPLRQGETAMTINPGDYLVKGTVTDEISASFTITDLREAHPGQTAVVREVNDLGIGTGSLHHLQIGAN